uniref:Uncharacterized protein n=1 Tax=Anguilla anguilla TaxID=7936 RepID=A0A0E9Q4H0_ANGAN
MAPADSASFPTAGGWQCSGGSTVSPFQRPQSRETTSASRRRILKEAVLRL